MVLLSLDSMKVVASHPVDTSDGGVRTLPAERELHHSLTEVTMAQAGLGPVAMADKQQDRLQVEVSRHGSSNG